MRYFLLGLLGLLISGPAYGKCAFQVSGKITFTDDVFVDKNSVQRNLIGAKVIISGSPGKVHPFRQWGSVLTRRNGQFVFRKKLITPCGQKHRFKVHIVFTDQKVRIENGGMQPFKHMARQTAAIGTKKNGRWRVNLGTIHLNETTYRAMPHNNSYYANRNAILWRAYHLQYDTLKAWRLTPQQIRVIHPEGPGRTGWADFISNRARLQRQWFDFGPSDDADDRPNRRVWAQTEAIHEHFHIWWNQHLFTPNFLKGKTAYTHEFVESPDLALYEAFAEWAANVFNRDVFGTPLHGILRPTSRNTLYLRFSGAVKLGAAGKRTEDKVWPDANRLKEFFRSEPKAFKKDFWSAEVVAENYLKLLTTNDWYRLSYGDLENASIPGEEPTGSCAGVPRQLFTPKALMRQLISWRSSKRMKPGKAGIKHFMKYLRDTDRTFRKYHRLVVDLGKPGKTAMPKEACRIRGQSTTRRKGHPQSRKPARGPRAKQR